MRRILFALAFCHVANGTLADQVTHTFEVTVSGIKAGTLRTTVTTNGTAYSVSGGLKPTRLLRAIRDISYAGQSAGTFKATRFAPRRYSGQTKTGSRNSAVKMRFTNKTPSVDSYSPERPARPYDIDPAKQRGTIDPITSAAIVFSDQTTATLCNQTIQMFDGRRRSQLALSAPTLTKGGAICNGTYTRVAGFSPDDMKERVNFPFSLMYTRINADTFRLKSFTTKTTFGSARASRK